MDKKLPGIGPLSFATTLEALNILRYGTIATTYGEVFWTGLPPAPLPVNLVKPFDNKVMGSGRL